MKVLMILLLMISSSLHAQDKAAQKILNKVSNLYDSYSSIQVVLNMTVIFPERENQQSVVTITQQGDKFVFDHPQQAMYCDGQNIWLYLADHNEVQINDYEQEEGDDYMISPKDLMKQYKSGKYGYKLESKSGSIASIIFKPLDRDSDYAKYRITIDTKKRLIKEIIAYGKDGSRVQLSVQKMTPNLKFEDSYFDFDTSKYPGVRVEDLRL